MARTLGQAWLEGYRSRRAGHPVRRVPLMLAEHRAAWDAGASAALNERLAIGDAEAQAEVWRRLKDASV